MNRQSVAALLSCAFMAASARPAVLPTDLEPKIGDNYQPTGPEERDIWRNLERVEEVIRDSPQRLISPELDAFTREVVEKLIGRAAPELRIYLVHDASLNAAMLPNGMMIINTGLLARVRNEAQLAAVLGHEAGHYFRRHSLELHRDERRKSSIARAAASGLVGYSESFGGWSQINQAILLSGFRFSRDLESEADAYGLMLMARAGYPPSAAAAVWGQFVAERQASAAALEKRYRDETRSVMSSHPPAEGRMTNLIDTADRLARKGAVSADEGREVWAEVILPFQPMLLKEQIYLNDAGASLYLLENLAKDGWTGTLRFYQGEVYRLRNARDDDRKAATAYAAAVALTDAPAEAWRAHGYESLKAGRHSTAHEALNRYLAMKPEAPDAALVRLALSPQATSDERPDEGKELIVTTGASWKKLPASANQNRWDEAWTWNGPQLDRITLLGGLPDGKALISQKANTELRVPPFRADMTAQDLVAMVEVSYRVNGVTVFNFDSVEPVDFLGGQGIRLRYSYVSGIGIEKRGHCVARIVGGRLYAMKLESLVGRIFDAVAPAFERLVAGARLGK